MCDIYMRKLLILTSVAKADQHRKSSGKEKPESQSKTQNAYR